MESVYKVKSGSFAWLWIMLLIVAQWASNLVVCLSNPSNSFFTSMFWQLFIPALIALPLSYKHLKRDLGKVKSLWSSRLIFNLIVGSSFVLIYYFTQPIFAKELQSINRTCVTSLGPALMILLCMLMYKESISRVQLIGAALCLVGACYAMMYGEWGSLKKVTHLYQEFFTLVSAVFYGFYLSLSNKFLTKISPATLSFCITTP